VQIYVSKQVFVNDKLILLVWNFIKAAFCAISFILFLLIKYLYFTYLCTKKSANLLDWIVDSNFFSWLARIEVFNSNSDFVLD
jgi:hypothetical protein